jgi:hypothetical protein
VEPDFPAGEPGWLGECRSVEHLDLIQFLLQLLKLEPRHTIETDVARGVDGDELGLDRAVAIPTFVRG